MMDKTTDWFERLKAERDELGERMGKLSAFLHSDKAHALSSEHVSLLRKQWLAMLSYYATLDQRIELAEKEADDVGISEEGAGCGVSLS